MDAPETPEEVHRRFDELAEELSHLGVSVSKMFGVPSLKAHGKAIGCLWGDSAVFKLPPERVAAALELKGTHRFDAMGDRPMKEWIVVPFAHAERWSAFASQALGYRTGG